MSRAPGNHGPDGRFTEGNRAADGRRDAGPRRPLREVKEHIQAWGIEMADVLISIVRNPRARPKDRIAAIKELYDRGYGRAKQAVEISGPGGGPLATRDIKDMTSAERGRRLVELLIKAGARLVPEEAEPTTPRKDEPDA